MTKLHIRHNEVKNYKRHTKLTIAILHRFILDGRRFQREFLLASAFLVDIERLQPFTSTSGIVFEESVSQQSIALTTGFTFKVVF